MRDLQTILTPPTSRLTVYSNNFAIAALSSSLNRTIQKQADAPTQELLKGSRWLLVKNREQLSDEEQEKLQKVLQASPILKECYKLKEAFGELFNQSMSRELADKKLTEWLRQVEATGLHALKSFVKTVMNWRESILNYFNGRSAMALPKEST